MLKKGLAVLMVAVAYLVSATIPVSATLMVDLTFDEGTGDTAFDASGYGNHATRGNATWTSDAMSGTALEFDGGDTVNAGTGTFGMDVSKAFTVSLWFKPSGSWTGTVIIRGRYVNPFRLYQTGDNMGTVVRTSGTNYRTGDSVITAGNWYHYVLTVEDSIRSGYFNGALDFSDTLSGSITASAGNATLIGPQYTGIIDIVQIYDNALSAGEVRDLYTAQLPVELSSFTAETSGDAVHLYWTTETETDNLGFNVLKRQYGENAFVRINAAIIPGAGTTTVPQSYSYTDAATDGGAMYRLEQVDTDGGLNLSDIIDVPATTGIALMENQTTDAAAGTRYTIRGIRATDTDNGIYIEMKNGKPIKIIKLHR